MNDSLKVRHKCFEELLKLGEKTNEKNWEMLCSSKFPLVPFFGAGISAWCYKTWGNLLRDIVSEIYSGMCAQIVNDAINCKEKPIFEDKTVTKEFHWMEEIAECIFDEQEERYKDNIKKFRLDDKDNKEGADYILRKLRHYVGEESKSKKSAAVKALQRSFDIELMNQSNKMPEYQNYFYRIFSGILITTNYDRALEKCYPSLFSYSYRDLNPKQKSKMTSNEVSESKKNMKKSWLYKAILAKISQMENIMANREELQDQEVTVPDYPMLLKVHGSIEQATSLALSRNGYEETYSGAMPLLLKEIFKRTTVVFMGYSLAEDRILDILKAAKNEQIQNNRDFPAHFAFLSKSENRDGKPNVETLMNDYGVHTILYDENVMPLEICRDEEERKSSYHDFCLGLLMENLMRRKNYFPRLPEFLWDKNRYQLLATSDIIKHTRYNLITRPESSYVRSREARQIWMLLNKSDECPLIAITGEHGSGKSTLCRNLMEFQQGASEMLQFFYISLVYCRSWDEFCIQLFQTMNIAEPVIPSLNDWKVVAEKVNTRCGGYWRSVLILDEVDDLKAVKEFPQLWDVFKLMLNYWREHQTRVVFVCQNYPEDIPCYVWHIGDLQNKDAKRIFFSTCGSGRYREISYLEEKVVNKLFAKETFRAATVEQLGNYANSKGDLTNLLSEWDLYYRPGDDGEKTVTRMLWNHFLNEHNYNSKNEQEKTNIVKNILWIWGILGSYPGDFPVVFLHTFCTKEKDDSYKADSLTRKTLRIMKNAGLCEETEEEKENIIIDNMVKCVDKYFLILMENHNCNIKEINNGFKDIVNKKTGHLVCGLKDFRTYIMQPSQAELKVKTQQIEYELRKEVGEVPEPEEEVLNILKSLSEEVKNNESRMKNRKLNLVLHYEIKSVIRFLTGRIISEMQNGNEKIQDNTFETAYNFSHFYHYVPQHAFTLVKHLLDKAPMHVEPYKIAELYRIMGDIQRLLGKPDAALSCYNKSLKLCDECLLSALESDGFFKIKMNSQPLEKKNKLSQYKECIRIKAGVLLIQNYSKEAVSCMQQAKALYESIDDEWGQAYYNQRMGELYKQQEGGKRENFIKALQYYNEAAKKYAKHGDKTGNAYILKCMGDVITEYKECWGILENQKYCLKEEKCETNNQSYIYYLIIEIGNNAPKGWTYDAVRCYMQAFMCYYTHINWRGFANVIQAMGTCFRISHAEEAGSDLFEEAVENMYILAEECYRWIGDVRGLADTLDYYGHFYKERVDEFSENNINCLEIEICKWKAYNKWKESEKLWLKLRNESKAEKARKNYTPYET